MLAARWAVPSVWERSGQEWSKELAELVGELRATGLDLGTRCGCAGLCKIGATVPGAVKQGSVQPRA